MRLALLVPRVPRVPPELAQLVPQVLPELLAQLELMVPQVLQELVLLELQEQRVSLELVVLPELRAQE